MDFGKLDDISGVDFKLPPDHKITTALLKQLSEKKRKPKQKVYVGAAKWGRPDWIGQLYPKKTKAADFLAHYVQHYNCIELNAMFYRLFPKAQVKKWAELAGDDFKFCPKFTQAITHRKWLKNAERETDEFLDTMSVFGNKLGTSFIQLNDRFGPKLAPQIHNYLKALPRDFDVSIEFRHPDWYENSKEVDEMFDLMKELGVSSVITDTSGRRDCLHMKLTTPTAFIRYVGNDKHPSDFERMNDWVKRIKKWLDGGMETIYFFVHNHDERYTPELSKYMIEQLNKHCKLDIKPITLINDNNTLF